MRSDNDATLEGLSDDELLGELGVTVEATQEGGRTTREERIVAGFEDIVRFFEQNGRPPRHGDDRDIFERLYAVRLDRIRELPEARELLSPIDAHGLLDPSEESAFDPTSLRDEDLLAELGAGGDISELRHVSSREDRQAADEIAKRSVCPDFGQFEPVFRGLESDLASGVRTARRFTTASTIETGDAFILGGQIAYVAEMGERTVAPNGQTNARLRVIYSNGTESNLLLRSLERALDKDETGRRISGLDSANLFGDTLEEGDVESGTIYVLRSLSDHPFVSEHRELIHKIGVTGGSVAARIADAKNDATYLLADVEVVAEYKLAGINRTKLENLFHRIFAPAQLDLAIQDRFGHPVRPREWFLVPLTVIDEAVERIRTGTITKVVYDPKNARLVEV